MTRLALVLFALKLLGCSTLGWAATLILPWIPLILQFVFAIINDIRQVHT